MKADKRRSGNYLSMDGGNDWFSALPALLTLEEMLKRLQRDLDLPEAPLPCKVFDVIIASSHAAVVALLVGKMRLTPSQAMDAYKKLEPALSVGPTEDEKERERNMDAFKKAFIEILEEHGFDTHSSMLPKEQDESEVKIIICTQNATSLLSLHLIRSYRVRGARPADCTILQAACASIASPDKFPPVKIGSSYREITLINALPNYANPTKVFLPEARRIFGDDGNVATIVSIGSGKLVVPDGLESTHGDLFADESITSKCEQVHEDVQTLLQKLFVYFRFNHSQIPGDTDNNLSINAQVSAYFQEEEISEHLDDAVESMRARKPGGNLLDINVVDKNQVKLKPRPSVAANFVGREDILEAMRERHFGEHTSKTRMPVITVLSGLGGSGKTQIACRFAGEFEDKCPNIPIYFLDASSEESLKADFETIIRSQGVIYRSQSCDDTLAWLAAKQRKWCLILDNADDPSFNLFPYIPKSAQGNVIITTRNSTHALLSPDAHHTVEGLQIVDAVALVLKMANYEPTAEHHLLAQAIVKELGSLPLALSHAGGYIFVHQCLSTYLNMYRASRAEFLNSHQALPQDYRLSIATTVQISLGKLPSAARDMMYIFSHLEVSSIPLQIISLPAERLFRVIDGQADEETMDEQTIQQAEILMEIFCSDGEWFESDFNISIQKCLEYSLLQITTRDDERFFSMHILVRTYLRYSFATIRYHQPEQLVARLLGSAITFDDHHTYHAFNRMLVPHIRLIPIDCVIEAGDHRGFGHILREQGSVSLAVEHHEWCLALRMSALIDESPDTITTMSDLASSYNELGRYQDSLDLEEKVLELRTRISGEEHPDTLGAMGNLALSYNKLGKYQKAIDHEEKVLELRRRISGDEHPDTLVAMSNLAMSYSGLGRYLDALDLEEKVLKLRTRISGDEHPDTLLAMNNLAWAYSTLGRHQEAIDLEEKLLELQTQISGDEHPDTLVMMGNLVMFYNSLGRHQDALELGMKVLELQTQILGDEHPSTLSTMGNLSQSYLLLEMYQEAQNLMDKTLTLRRRILGEEHPDTLVATAILATALSQLGMTDQAIALLQATVPLYEKVRGVDYPDTLRIRQFLEYLVGSSDD